MPSEPPPLHGLFGHPPAKLAAAADGCRQFSPLSPDADALDAVPPGALASMTMLAAPGTVERQHDLAATLRALAPDAPFQVLAPKALGGTRLHAELVALGCASNESSKAHHRICRGTRPLGLDDDVLRQAIEAGAPQFVTGLRLWSQPGIFSWDRIDPGTSLLCEALTAPRRHQGLRPAGRGADFGCGIGVLAHAVLALPEVTRLHMVDIDRRAIAAARRNVDDPRVDFAWTDIKAGIALSGLDFVVTNPPFHERGHEDRSLGEAFIRQAAAALRKGGRLWLVANRHLPYESLLALLFRETATHREAHGYKVIEAVK